MFKNICLNQISAFVDMFHFHFQCVHVAPSLLSPLRVFHAENLKPYFIRHGDHVVGKSGHSVLRLWLGGVQFKPEPQW